MRCAIVGYVLGIMLLQQQASLPDWPMLVAVLGCAIAVLVCRSLFFRSPAIRLGMHLLSGILLGWSWASVFALLSLSQQLSPRFEERELTVIGVVTGLPTATEYGQRFQFSIEQILDTEVRIDDLPGKVLLSWNQARRFSSNPVDLSSAVTDEKKVAMLAPGSRWQLHVRLRRPHGLANPHGFDYEVWLLEQGLGATGSVVNMQSTDLNGNREISPFVLSINNLIEITRGYLRARILAALPQGEYAPIIVALVIGEQHAIAAQDWAVFARTGVSHLIAISGMHVSIVAGFFAQLMYYFWRHSFFTNFQLPLIIPAQKIATLSGIALALVYVALAGFGVPAQRSLIMLSVVAAAVWFDRVSSASYVLCFALAAVLLVDPWAVLWPGFWLSFAAVGFIFFAHTGAVESHSQNCDTYVEAVSSTRFQLFFFKIKQYAHQSTGTQYAVTLGLVPLTVLLFNQVSLISPIANAVAIPLVSLLITPGALLGSVLPAPVGDMILQLTHTLLVYLVQLLTWLSLQPWAVWQAPRPDNWMFVIAMLGTCWCLAPKAWPLRWAGLLTWLPLGLHVSAYPPAGQFTVTALDIGQGMALLIETEHHRLLYDTGPTYSQTSDAGSRVIYPYLAMRGIYKLDGLLISHNDNDHSGGALSLMQRMKMGWVMSSLAQETKIVQTAQLQSQHLRCLAGQSWQWDGVRFDILHPSESIYASSKWKPNAKSCTLKITQGAHSILLAGDIEATQEDELIGRIPDQLPSSVLLAPHHGSGTSSTLKFLHLVDPKIAIFQYGYHNRYHHPKPSVWQRYADLGITRLSNDVAGAVTLHFGEQLSVETYRQTHARYWFPAGQN